MKRIEKLAVVTSCPHPGSTSQSLMSFASNDKQLLVEASDDFSLFVLTALTQGRVDPRRGKVVIPASNVRSAVLAAENKAWDPAAPEAPAKAGATETAPRGSK